jgi:hypothetical protein
MNSNLLRGLYTSGPEGVAVKSTVGRLVRVLHCDQRTVFVDRVEYLDLRRAETFAVAGDARVQLPTGAGSSDVSKLTLYET